MIRELLVEDFSWWAVMWQSSLFAVAGLAGSFLLRRRPSRACQVLFLAMIAAVFVPTMSILVKYFDMGFLVAEPTVLESDVPDEVVLSLFEAPATLPHVDIPEESPVGVAEPAATKAASRGINVPWQTIAMYGWLSTAFILIGRLLVAFIGGVHLLRTAQLYGSEQVLQAADSARARLGMVRGLQICSSKSLRSPVIWCWSRPPVLLVPADLSCVVDWVGVISHEIAHWKRWDHVSGLLAELVVCILPWNPLLWWCKKRMIRLSEQACDDWVVEGGQPGTEYAQSLLNLSPEVQMAFLPTVIGKEKPMKERICRIVTDGCGNPRVGIRWAIGVGVLAVLAGVGVAFAQQRPRAREYRVDIEQPEARREQAPERAMVAGRRNVLSRLRDQLQDQIRRTEAALRERGDQPGEEGRVLDAELQTLREQAALVERQLRALDGDRRRPAEARPESPEREARLNDLRRLVENARRVERELEGLRDGQDVEARELKAQLEQIHAETREVEKQLAEAQRSQARGRTVRPMSPQPQDPPEGVRQRRAELSEEIRRLENRLKEVPPERDQEIRELKARLEQLHAETNNRPVERQRVQGPIERVRADVEPRQRTAPAGDPRLEAQVDELRNQMRELREQMQQMQRLMEQSAARGPSRENTGERERRNRAQ